MAVFLAILKNLGVNLALNGCVFDNIGCVFDNIGCVFDNIGCIFASHWM